MTRYTGLAGAVAATILIWSHDKLTWAQVGWCWAVVAAAVSIYTGSCWWFPFGYCMCCKGRGSHKRKDGKVFRDCRHILGWGCGGTGRRLRAGRRVYNFIHKQTKHG